ncbi:MAG TPA: S24 family peptidase [Candidatus Bacteroides pullicola]|uniref:S24 family peptidase n=1 Tax=Candidatus Bacteroides pullicola TaxID=2838475 RepID=A0A9D1ZL72_9BACE|nr:S24 family peptidase [Candidatus Bacteroides pullicola]
MGIIERFFECIEQAGISSYEIEKKYGVKSAQSKLSQLKETKTKGGKDKVLPSDLLSAVCTAREDINSEYILTGRGKPLKGVNEETGNIVTSFPSSSKDIKILDIRVCAGLGIGFDGDENKVVGYVNIPDFTGCYGITVYGDSMYDMYMPGDTIFVREIRDKTSIDNGQPYVVITREDRLLKMVYVEENGLRLVSYNTACNPDGRRKYPDMLIEGEQILYLYKVVGKLARNQM